MSGDCDCSGDLGPDSRGQIMNLKSDKTKTRACGEAQEEELMQARGVGNLSGA